MKTGTVVLLNPTTRRCAVLVDDSEHSILEMRYEIGLSCGDRVSGPLEDLGSTVIVRNLSTGWVGEVWIDDYGQSREVAVDSLRLS